MSTDRPAPKRNCLAFCKKFPPPPPHPGPPPPSPSCQSFLVATACILDTMCVCVCVCVLVCVCVCPRSCCYTCVYVCVYTVGTVAHLPSRGSLYQQTEASLYPLNRAGHFRYFLYFFINKKIFFAFF